MVKKIKMREALNNNEKLLIDESFSIHRKHGNGVIKRQVWVNQKQEVTRYSVAYINHHISQGDHGRVLGYDNAHGYHHKHVMGKIEPTVFTSWDDIEKQFQQEFEVLHEQVKNKKL